MSYEKPEVFVLSIAARAVLTRDNNEGSDSHRGKGAFYSETFDISIGDQFSVITSSTGSAYEADE